MGRIKEWAINHKGATTAIATSVAGVVGTIIWGLLPEKETPIGFPLLRKTGIWKATINYSGPISLL